MTDNQSTPRFRCLHVRLAARQTHQHHPSGIQAQQHPIRSQIDRLCSSPFLHSRAVHPGAAQLPGSALPSDCQPYYSLQLPSRFPPPFPPSTGAGAPRTSPGPARPPRPRRTKHCRRAGAWREGRPAERARPSPPLPLPPSSPSGGAPTCGPRRLLGKSRPRPAQPPAPASPASACCCPRGPHGGGGLPVRAAALGRRGRGERGGRRRRLRQPLSWSAAAPAVAAAAPRSRYFLCGDGSVPPGPLGAGEPGGVERRRKIGAERGAAVRRLPPLRTGAGAPAHPAARAPFPRRGRKGAPPLPPRGGRWRPR